MIQKKWKNVVLKSTALFVLLTAMVVSYQNCGKAGFDQADLGSEFGQGESIDPKLANLPFPYKVSVNQVAFMSCQFREVAANADTPYFSFKVGAFDNSPGNPTSALVQSKAGLTIEPEFSTEFNRVATAFNSDFRSTKYKEALTHLPSVANTNLQLSVRTIRAPASELAKFTVMGGAGGGSLPTKKFLAPITGDAISETFKAYMNADTQPTYNFFQAAGMTAERSFQASLTVPWGTNAGGLNYYSDLVNTYNTNLLTIGFAKDDINLATNSSDGETAYGVGLRPEIRTYNNISSGFGASTVGISHTMLYNLKDWNLKEGGEAPGANWRCSDSSGKLMAFKIVKQEDRFKKIHRKNNFSWPNTGLPGRGQVFNGTCPSPAYPRPGAENVRQDFMEGEYCPSPENPGVFGRPLREFPLNGGFACPEVRRDQLPASSVTTGQPPAGTQLNNRSFHAYGRFCEEQYEYACPPEPMFRPKMQIPGQPPLSENAYLAHSTEKLAIYYALRRFLPESQWDINVSKRCVVERTGQSNVCYSPSNNNRPIVYDEFYFPASLVDKTRDIAQSDVGRYTGCGPNQAGDCPAFVTLCVRQ